ncbi:unnamed protein product [Rotaria socialis]|uniref:CNH domain-containing protein n=1 Tax=Rotaria socialis TaxID=392032 RepID=A0A817X0L8_9BILA|nr:unnamed protein product [Rotaria socialis]CAF4439539.1 unnamed protein product [Rotaria socialis]
MSTCIRSQHQSSNQLYQIVTGLKQFHSQLCQFKFENCIQDSSYADQLDTDCNIYSRLRDCFRSLLDDSQCLSAQLKDQYTKAKQNEYQACGVASSYESVRSSSIVHKFRIRDKASDESASTETKGYECLCIGSQNLGTRKSIVKIKVVRIPLHRVFTLSDNLIQILDSDNLQPIPNLKIKNVLTFGVSNATDQCQGGYVDICVSTKRNKIQIYRLDKLNMNFGYELSVQDSFTSIAMDSCGIIGCSETEYFSYDPSNSNDRRSTGSFNSIFKLDDPNTAVCFTNISPGQYLLNGPNVGVTTSLQGMSQRPPIMFVSSPIDFIYSHPYLIVLVRDYIHIYSYLDDQLKQEIPLKFCRTLLTMQQENIKNIIVTNKDNIYLLVPLSIEEQIEQLLNSYRLQEALTLAESTCSSIKQRSTNRLVLSTKKRIAFIEFSAMNVVRALCLFDDIHIDFHEILTQIPNFLPINSSWSNIDENNKSQYVQWLNALGDYMTRKSAEFSHQPDYYPVLLKAYLLVKTPEMIIEFIQTNASYVPMDYCKILIDAQHYNAAAILYSSHEKHQQAIDIWKKLVSNEYSNDDTFPGVWILAKYILERNIDRSLEFSTAAWFLERNEEELALKIFTNKHRTESNNDPFSSQRVINLIKTHQTALVTYLEYAVFKLQLQTDEIHTMLVNIYLDQILSKSDNEETRSKLQAFIITSNSYRVQTVLHRVNQTNRLKREVALLYGKMNNFEQAFRILVDELQDLEYAENYCIALSHGKSSADRKIVAHVLFKVFLNSLEKYPNEIKAALLRLLCNNEIEFDFIEVLQRLPSHWSLASLSQILLRALRTYSYTQRAAKLESSLVRVQNEQLNIKLSQLKRSNTMINEQRQCKHCLQQFYETSCVVYQDGIQVHVHCAKKYKQN